MHSHRTQLGDPLAQPFLSDGNWVVKVDGAGSLHPVFLIQHNFRWHSADGRSDGCDGDGREVSDCTIASEDYNRPAFVWWGEVVEADIASCYSCGHAASASQSPDSLSAGVCVA